MRVLSQRIGREHNNRRSLLEPSTVIPGTTVEDPVLESNIINKESDSDTEEDNQPNEDGIYSDNEDNQEKTSMDNAAVITISHAATESPIS